MLGHGEEGGSLARSQASPRVSLTWMDENHPGYPGK